MESIKDKVAVVGMGCTNFGEKWGDNPDDMAVEATKEALEDAGLELKDINAGIQATLFTGETGSHLARWLKLNYVPVTRVENYCSGGLDSFR
ncbi:acetyl-CoA acetyltransferase, partial [Chloroflexota bacterium]